MMRSFKRFILPSSKRSSRRVMGNKRVSFFQWAEKSVIRAMILGTVLLVLFQITSITDPVDFYLKIAGDIDSPAFKYDQYVNESPQTGEVTNGISLSFQTIPQNAPVIVMQNDQILAVLGKDNHIKVVPGKVMLDGTQIPYPVTVEIILHDKSYSIDLNLDQKSFDVQLKS